MSSVAASIARCDMLPLPMSSAAFSGTSRARFSSAPDLELPDALTLVDRSRHGPSVDEARDQALATAARHHQADRAGADQRNVASIAAEHLRLGDRLALCEQNARLEAMEAPFQHLARFVGAFFFRPRAGDDDDQAQIVSGPPSPPG